MDIVLRATIVFLILGLVMRITGKRQIAQLSAFDLILIVTMGDLVGQTVLQEDYSLTAGTLAVLTFGLLSMLMGLAMYFMPKSRPLLRGHATILIRDGDLDHEVLKNEMIHIHDLNEAARQAGIRDLSDVELAIMETDGTFSFFTKKSEEPDDSSERGSVKTK
jgi:uncharacterized membrane protein YcaP (DUF421 family)